MPTNRQRIGNGMDGANGPENGFLGGGAGDGASLGAYLKARRARLDPVRLGLAPGRRRTPGLRREEVALRAHISPTWYTWLEQGRGGSPSAEALERVCQALLLTEAEREHVFLLGLGRAPDVRYRPAPGVTPRLQRVLDALETSPALIRTATWDVLAWNRAFALVMTDYGRLPPARRNVLRQLFLNPATRAAQTDWEGVARTVVALFRADAARAGAGAEMQTLAAELSAASPEFAAFWQDRDVRGFEESVKRLHHSTLGTVALEYSSFAIAGRPELSMLVYGPATEADRAGIERLVRQDAARDGAAGSESGPPETRGLESAAHHAPLVTRSA